MTFPACSTSRDALTRWTKALLLSSLLAAPALSTAGQWDDLRLQWVKERKALTTADIPALREAASRDDLRAAFLLFNLPDNNRLGVDTVSMAAELTQVACRKASEGNPIALTWCARALLDGSSGQRKDIELARKHLERATGEGYAASKSLLAYLYAYGVGVAKSEAKALALYNEAASAGDGYAAYALGGFYESGNLGLPVNSTQAIDLYRTSASHGYTAAVFKLAEAYVNGSMNLHRDEAKALGYFREAASQNHCRSMAYVGRFHQLGLAGLLPDEGEANSWFASAKRCGSAEDLFWIGMDFESGLNAQDARIDLAIPWYRSAADMGSVHAATRLSYWLGDAPLEALRNVDEANRWLIFAAEKGDTSAMRRLAFALARGSRGLPVDAGRAFELSSKCVAKGDSSCLHQLASYYRKGVGVAPDIEKSLQLFKQAAELGDAYALGVIGEFYDFGEGVAKDPALATDYIRRAALAGSGIHMSMLASRLSQGYGVERNFNEAARWQARAFLKRNEANRLDGETASQRAKRLLDHMLAEGQITDPEVLAEVKKAFAPPPSVTWAGLRGLWATEAVEIPYQLRDEGGGLGDVQLLVNGQVVDRHAAPAQAASKGAVRSGRFQLKLSAGQYEVEVRAYGAENLGTFGTAKSTLSSTWQRVKKPRLHMVVVGVDQFAAPELKLSYAASDARAVYALLSKQVGPLFDQGRMHLLTGRPETSKARIQQAVAQVVEQAESDDVFVFYAASHGFNYDSGGYHLLTSDVASRQAAQVRPASLSHKELRDLFSQVRARKKLVLLDTCQAGRSLVADELVGASRGLGLKDDERELIDAMRSKSGATVLMASESEQLAYEGYKGHGLFTYALLEALSQASAGKTGLISTDAVMSHVETRVPQLAREVFKAEQRTYASKAGTAFPLVKWP